MLLPLTLLSLSLAAAQDAGSTSIAPVTPVPGAPAEPQAKLPDVTPLPFGPDSISQVVAAHQTDIQDCYEKTLAARNEKLQGRLMTHFNITPAGTVSGAQVEKRGTTLKDKGLHACVVGVLSKLRFPKPPDAKNHPIEFPFNLKAIE